MKSSSGSPRRLSPGTNIRAIASLPSTFDGREAVSSPAAARMRLYERYAHLVADEYALRAAGSRDDAERAGRERLEVQQALEALASSPSTAAAFAEALADAEAELAHREAVDASLRERLAELGHETARAFEAQRPPGAPALPRPPEPVAHGRPPGTTLDRRF